MLIRLLPASPARGPRPGPTRALLGLALTLAVGLPGCAVKVGGGKDETPEAKKEEKKKSVPIPVSVVPVRQETLVLATRTTTVLRARRSVVVKSELAGVVAELPIEEGSALEARGLLARLDSKALELELERTRLSWELSRRTLARQKEMLDEKLTSQREYEQALFDEKLAANAVAVARHQIELATIEAPFAGVVAERMVEVGQTITVGQEIARLVALDPLEADLHLPVQDAWRLNPGDEVELTSARLPVDRLVARVRRVAPVVDEKTGTAKVVLEVPSIPGVKPGVFFEAHLVEERIEDALVIPREAVVFRGTDPVVYRVVDGNPVPVTVAIGAQTETSFQVTAGLEAGDRIVLEGAGGLRPDSVIRILDPLAPAGVTAPSAGVTPTIPPAGDTR